MGERGLVDHWEGEEGWGAVTAWTSGPPAPVPLPIKPPPPFPDCREQFGETSRGDNSHLVISVILHAFSHLICLSPYSQKCSKEGLRLERVEMTTQGHAV